MQTKNDDKIMNKVGKVQIFFWSVKFTVTRNTELYMYIYM